MVRKIIRDSIHGDIFLSALEVEVVDTPEFQRLRRIKQLGLTNLVYPSANHTRFEHSIGTMHLAGKIADRLNLEEKDKNLICLAALLHDIGHGPLSHTSEELLARYLNISHERISIETVKNSDIATIVERYGIHAGDITDIIAGKKGYMSKIISSEVDIDRMDYLVRDAHHTGVGYGIIDLHRLINTIELFDGNLVFNSGGLRAIEGLLVARFLMTPSVYLHHTSRIADAMFLKATEYAIQEGIIDFETMIKFDDIEIQSVFRRSAGYVGEIGERLDLRRLFKKVVVKGWHDISPVLREKIISLREDVERIRKIEREIAEEANVGEEYVIIDIPPEPEYREMDAVIEKNGKIVKIEEESPLVSILKLAQKSYWDMGIYTRRKYVGKVARVADNIESFFE